MAQTKRTPSKSTTKRSKPRAGAPTRNGEHAHDLIGATPPKPNGAEPIDSSPAPNELTIEQLAAEAGMSVRNIRNHHTRGLLPAPEVRARVGYYNAEHVARLRLILDLQADGFNLAAIEPLLSGSDGLAERLLGLRRAVTTPFEPENAEMITIEELTKRFGEVDLKDI